MCGTGLHSLSDSIAVEELCSFLCVQSLDNF